MILAWSGNINAIPKGWQLCDGSNGTPDLRDRFIVGAGNSYNIGSIGGENYHTLSISEIPSHNHTTYEYLANLQQGWEGGAGSSGAELSGVGGGSRFDTNYTGGSQSHENRPPYYALAFIQRI